MINNENHLNRKIKLNVNYLALICSVNFFNGRQNKIQNLNFAKYVKVLPFLLNVNILFFIFI